MEKLYINWLPIIMIPVGLIIFAIFGFLILFPVANSPDWIIWGTFILSGITLSIWISFILPFVLIIRDDVAIFIGFPWVNKIKREKLRKVIINKYSFSFIPKVRTDYKFVYNSKYEKYKGYKYIGFYNLEAWGDLIVFFKPLNPGIDIKWEVLTDREREYIQDKLY
ncbi:MAG: hypothetical protein JSV56_07325 [Methanomassiliicoccales archaeon]|nr:MAG: hypothetical protein JSV56_07325 [Methanomassiliicoccales archaeon]